MDWLHSNLENFPLFKLVTILLGTIFGIYIVIRLIIQTIAWCCEKWLSIKLKVGSVKIIQFEDISIQFPNGLTFHIECIQLSSRFWNTQHKSLIGVTLVGLRIQGHLKDLHKKRSNAPSPSADSEHEQPSSSSSPLPPTSLPQSAVRRASFQSQQQQQIASFASQLPGEHSLEKRLVHLYLQFIQSLRSNIFFRLVSIHVQNFSFNQLGISNDSFKVDCLLNTTIQDLHLRFQYVGKDITCSLNAGGICLRLFKSGLNETCLADFSFNSSLQLQLDKDNSLDVNFQIDQLQTIIFDGLPVFTANIQSSPQTSSKVKSKSGKIIGRELLEHCFALNLKNLIISVNNTSLKFMKDHGQKVLSTGFDHLQIKVTRQANASFELKLSLNELQSTSRQIQFLVINQINLAMQAERESSLLSCLCLIIHMEVIDCELDYNELEFCYWMQYLHSFRISAKTSRQSHHQSKTSWLDSLLNQNSPYVKINFSTVVSNFRFNCSSRKDTANLYLTLNHFKLSNSIDPDPLVKELTCECLFETLCCYKSKRAQPQLAFAIEELDSIDYKQMPLYLNTIIIKANHSEIAELKVNCVANLVSLNFDYFYTVLDHFLISQLKTQQQTDAAVNSAAGGGDQTLGSYQQNSSSSSGSKLPMRIQVNTNSLAVFVDQHRLNLCSLIFDKNVSKMSIALNQTEISSLKPLTLNSKGSEHKILEVSKFKFLIDEDNHRRQVNLNDTVYIQWNLPFHLKLCKIVDNLTMLSTLFRSGSVSSESNSSASSSSSSPSFASSSSSSAFTSQKRSSSFLEVQLNGKIELGALLSNAGSSTQLVTNNAHLEYQDRSSFKFATSHLRWLFDNQPVLTFSCVNIQKLDEHEASSQINRRIITAPTLMTEKNRALSINIGDLNINFPYKFNFAMVFNERLVTIFKWLKKYHASRSATAKTPASSIPSTSSATLGSTNNIAFDLKIKIDRGTFEICDDPFERRLQDNFRLMVDDQKAYEATVKKMLVGKEKIEKLMKELELKREGVYIGRHRIMTEKDKGQTAVLFTVCVYDLDLIAIADRSIGDQARLRYLIREQLDKPGQLPDQIRFSTLWGRQIDLRLAGLLCKLREFGRPMVKSNNFQLSGLLVGGEQEANSRAQRDCWIDQGLDEPPLRIARSMTTLKFFHDLEIEVDQFLYVHGACWEPILQQLSICFESIIKPSVDPSPALPWYDKMRYLFHGRLEVKRANKLALAFHGSLNPFNVHEFLEFCFINCRLVWLIGKIELRGDLDVFVHTESKYDELSIVHLPMVILNIDLFWKCIGNQYDHYAVSPCAADKLPEYSSNQVHDSYRAFRSQYLEMAISLETDRARNGTPGSASSACNDSQTPTILLYSSTLRWLKKQRFVFAGFPKLTRRGVLFNNTKPRKQPFSRIFKRIRLYVCLHKLKLSYYWNFSRQYGFEIMSGYLSHCSGHLLSFVPFRDGLKRRPQPVWKVDYMNSEIYNVEIWLYENVKRSPSPNTEHMQQSDLNKEDCEATITSQSHYLLSLPHTTYQRNAVHHSSLDSNTSNNAPVETPTHTITIHDLKGAWTKENRDIALTLFDLFIKSEQLRRNLSTDALKAFHPDNAPSGSSPSKGKYTTGQAASPASTLNRGHANSMLQKLIEDSEQNQNVVCTEDVEGSLAGSTSTGGGAGGSSGGSTFAGQETKLRGIAACSDDDVLHQNWHIVLLNSQLMLRGIETQGYLIVSAEKTEIRQRLHKPVWKERHLYAKSTWIGTVECMQYYATLDPVKSGDIVWLSVDNIKTRQDAKSSTSNSNIDLALPKTSTGSGTFGASTLTSEPGDPLVDLVGSSQCAGGLVTAALLSPSVTFPGVDQGQSLGMEPTSVDLQRIISQCGCEFYYTSFNEQLASGQEVQELPPLPEEPLIELWDNEQAVDSFTFMHPNLNISTNSQQFRMIIDIVNNLLCYVRPQRRKANEELQRMRFKTLLQPLEVQLEPILEMQQKLRDHVHACADLEREIYEIRRKIVEERAEGRMPDSDKVLKYRDRLRTYEAQVPKYRERIDDLNERLSMRISVFQESQLTEDRIKQREAAAQDQGGTFVSSVIGRIEIYFQQATWRLTDKIGQLGLSDLNLSDCLYTKIAKNDDIVEHTLELGNIKVQNLLPNQAYRTVLQPTRAKFNVPLDQHRVLRVFCREAPPVGGIPVKEHFEINVIPLTIELTSAFVKEMLRFFFPEKYEPLSIEDASPSSLAAVSTAGGGKRRGKKGSSSTKDDIHHHHHHHQDTSSGSASRFVSSLSISSQKQNEEMEEKMRQRALRNISFQCIKIQEVPIRLSYKGRKEKNFEDFNDIMLILPPIEYTNKNFTWLDLLLAIKDESKNRLIGQAVRQKLRPKQIFASSSSSKQQADQEDEELTEQQQKAIQQEEEEQKARLLLGRLAVPFSAGTLEKGSKFKGSGLSIFSQKK